jgi:hypothetical protein
MHVSPNVGHLYRFQEENFGHIGKSEVLLGTYEEHIGNKKSSPPPQRKEKKTKEKKIGSIWCMLQVR